MGFGLNIMPLGVDPTGMETITVLVDVSITETVSLFSSDKKDVDPGIYDINKLMMLEGRIAMMYWDNLSLIFNRLYPEFNFKSRKNKSYSWNNNASDEINALLNYGYVILESQARRCINTAGLDPCVGYLHEMVNDKTPLVYDVLELYRWLVDLSVIELLEEKKLKKSDFITTENYNIRLRPETAKMLLDRIRINLNAKKLYMSKNVSLDTLYMHNTGTSIILIFGE